MFYHSVSQPSFRSNPLAASLLSCWCPWKLLEHSKPQDLFICWVLCLECCFSKSHHCRSCLNCWLLKWVLQCLSILNLFFPILSLMGNSSCFPPILTCNCLFCHEGVASCFAFSTWKCTQWRIWPVQLHIFSPECSRTVRLSEKVNTEHTKCDFHTQED